jgi:hypothetical protein
VLSWQQARAWQIVACARSVSRRRPDGRSGRALFVSMMEATGLPGCPRCREQFLNPHRLRCGLQAVERVIAIMERISRRLVPRKGLAKLLHRPRRRRMRGDRNVPDASPIMGEKHQDEQKSVGRGRDHEEIGRDDLADMIRQERSPRLRWRLPPASHMFRDGRLTTKRAGWGACICAVTRIFSSAYRCIPVR